MLGIRFCNEVVVATQQLHPTAMEVTCNSSKSNAGTSTIVANSQLYTAIPFIINLGASTPPSVRLIPCRPYQGAPIGTGYELQLFCGTTPDELPASKRKVVTMSLRLKENQPREINQKADVYLERRSWFASNDNLLIVKASLDAAVYTEDDQITLSLHISRRKMDPNRGKGTGIKRIYVSALQQVGIALFSTGTFKNEIGNVSIEPEGCDEDFSLDPKANDFSAKIPIKLRLSDSYSWAAMDETSKKDSELVHLAPTVSHANRALFIVRVSYYIKVHINLGMFTKPINIRLPFTLKRSPKAMAAFKRKEDKSIKLRKKSDVNRTPNGGTDPPQETDVKETSKEPCNDATESAVTETTID